MHAVSFCPPYQITHKLMTHRLKPIGEDAKNCDIKESSVGI